MHTWSSSYISYSREITSAQHVCGSNFEVIVRVCTKTLNQVPIFYQGRDNEIMEGEYVVGYCIAESVVFIVYQRYCS